MRKGLQEARNCGGKYNSDFVLALSKDLVVKECPVGLITPLSWYLLRMFHLCHSSSWGGWVQHSWPDEGGVNDQLALIVNAFEVIREEYAKIEKEESKKGAR